MGASLQLFYALVDDFVEADFALDVGDLVVGLAGVQTPQPCHQEQHLLARQLPYHGVLLGAVADLALVLPPRKDPFSISLALQWHVCLPGTRTSKAFLFSSCLL